MTYSILSIQTLAKTPMGLQRSEKAAAHGLRPRNITTGRIEKRRGSARTRTRKGDQSNIEAATTELLLKTCRYNTRSKSNLSASAAHVDVPKSTDGCRKRKRDATTLPYAKSDQLNKRLRTDSVNVQQPDSFAAASGANKREELASDNHSSPDCVRHWSITGKWPSTFFGDNVQGGSNMQRLLPGGRNLVRSNSSGSSRTPSERRSRDEDSARYRHPGYEQLLERQGSYLRPAQHQNTEEIKQVFSALLRPRNDMPTGTLFDDDIFPATISGLHNRNEWKVIQDIGRLIVPSAEELANRKKIDPIVIETVNESWINSIAVIGSRPQPDYAVGFNASAFGPSQMEKLTPLIGGLNQTSPFVATYQIFFPFLSSEVKCGNAALDVADRQNAHTATVEVRGVFELFKLAGRQCELEGVILAFSLSHDDNYVRIYGHYITLCDGTPKYYRVAIRNFSFTELEGKEKWTAYNFVRNVYEDWVPKHLKRICSAIDMLPDDLGGPAQEDDAQGLSRSGLSQSQPDSSSSHDNLEAHSQDIATPASSVSHPPESNQPGLKKVKRTR